MTLALVPGQNAPLPVRQLRFTASAGVALDISALVVGQGLRALSSDHFVFYNQPHAAGVTLRGDGVDIDLDSVESAALGVLCVVSVDAPAAGAVLGRASAALADSSGADVASFATEFSDNETSGICFELYRRGTDWKVRAFGQGYAGGLAPLLTAHGVQVDDSGEAAPAGSSVSAGQVSSDQVSDRPLVIEPLDPANPLERMWMIFEDAARSTAALVSASDYATKRLDDEMSASVADPAIRNTPAAAAASADAHRRHDELVATAQISYRGDAEHLIAELAGIDAALPRSLASWESVVWQSTGASDALRMSGAPLAAGSNGIRIGVATAPESGPLAVPFCVPAPLRRPIWIDTTAPAAVAPVVTALVLRLLAAQPSPVPILDVVDLTGGLESLTAPLSPLLRGPVVRSHHDVSAKLVELVNAIDLAEMGAQNGITDLELPSRVLVLSDFGTGLTVDDVNRVSLLAARGQAAGLSVLIVGDDESASGETMMRDLHEYCQHLPLGGAETRILDPWTRNSWQFTPDTIPTDASRIAQLMNSVLAG